MSVGVTASADAFLAANDPATNFGGAGALQVAGAGTTNGRFDLVLKFDTSAAQAAFDTQFGSGNWTVSDVRLRLVTASGGQSLFNPLTSGDLNAVWMQNNTWVEGTGSPVSPTNDGITAATLPTFQGVSDQSLGVIHFNSATSGVSGTATSYSLSPSSGLLSQIAAGGLVSLELSPADNAVSYLFYSRNFSNANHRPVLSITAVPEPGTLVLLSLGTGSLLWHRRRRTR